MKIIKITPRGFCCGVVDAWKKTIDTIKNNPNKQIYMLGLFVHNQAMIDSLKSDNLEILDDTNISRYKLVKKIKNPKNKILLLSAHGTDWKTIRLAQRKKMEIIDTTCEYVYKTHDIIKQALKDKINVIYIGKKNHPESNATIKISRKVNFIYELDQLRKLKKYFNKDVIITNQTTLSIYDLKNYYDFIGVNFKKAIIRNDLCDATIKRQEALMLLKEKVNKLIVVGYEKSNNSQQLLKIGKTKNIDECYLINDINELKKINFYDNDCVAITSGASTPTWITNEIINYLESLKWN